MDTLESIKIFEIHVHVPVLNLCNTVELVRSSQQIGEPALAKGHLDAPMLMSLQHDGFRKRLLQSDVTLVARVRDEDDLVNPSDLAICAASIALMFPRSTLAFGLRHFATPGNPSHSYDTQVSVLPGTETTMAWLTEENCSELSLIIQNMRTLLKSDKRERFISILAMMLRACSTLDSKLFAQSQFVGFGLENFHPENYVRLSLAYVLLENLLDVSSPREWKKAVEKWEEDFGGPSILDFSTYIRKRRDRALHANLSGHSQKQLEDARSSLGINDDSREHQFMLKEIPSRLREIVRLFVSKSGQ